MLKQLFFPLMLITAMCLGALTGLWFPNWTPYLKPLGDIFLRLILTAIVPLIFFSVATAIARAKSRGELTKIFSTMMTVFLITGLIASIYMLFVVKFFPPALGVHLNLESGQAIKSISLSEQLVSMITVGSFAELFNHANILPLILFSILIGLAIPKDKPILQFLQSGEELMLNVFSYIMYYAPIGFYAYFSVLVTELGPKIMTTYARVTLIYYVAALIYFIVFYSMYAAFCSKFPVFWKNIIVPSLTALATCSSAASMPANITATKKMNVPAEIVETTMPLGTVLHKEGSILGGMVKIAFLFGVYNLSFADPYTCMTAIIVSLLVGTVMGAIPSGGMLGELLILNIYGFPSSALISIAAISIIIDPLATLLNVTGNSISSLLIGKILNFNEEKT